MRCHFFFVLLLAVVFSVFGVELHIEGYVPPRLDMGFLKKEYERIARQVGVAEDDDLAPLRIIFYRASDRRRTGIRLPEWGGGGAIGKDTIVIPVDRPSAFYRSDMQRVILHEMVHIALSRAYGSVRLPRWFHEGTAMTLSGDLMFEEQIILSKAILTRSLIPLDSIEYLNLFGLNRARIAYCQCHFAVGFLIDTYGIDLIPELLTEVRKTRRFESACIAVFGLTTDELEKLLHKEMVLRYRFLFLISDYSFFWIGVLALAVAGFVATMIRNKRKSRQMEEEEKLEAGSEASAIGS